jgi:hypothetical protein
MKADPGDFPLALCHACPPRIRPSRWNRSANAGVIGTSFATSSRCSGQLVMMAIGIGPIITARWLGPHDRGFAAVALPTTLGNFASRFAAGLISAARP